MIYLGSCTPCTYVSGKMKTYNDELPPILIFPDKSQLNFAFIKPWWRLDAFNRQMCRLGFYAANFTIIWHLETRNPPAKRTTLYNDILDRITKRILPWTALYNKAFEQFGAFLNNKLFKAVVNFLFTHVG